MQTGASTTRLGMRERKKREVRRSIRDHALRLFLAEGYAQVSVEQIAAAADVSRSTFFNHFATKEAVIFEPDPADLEGWHHLCAQRPAGEPLWHFLTEVILGCSELSKDWLVAQKLVKDSAPDEIHLMHENDNLLISFLREWVDRRTPPGELTQAHLQLNVAMGATMTAFVDWNANEPFQEFLATATAFLHQLGQAFPTG